jgi:UDP:flavonoid glycosyltransferase YjiC (YdhE family)
MRILFATTRGTGHFRPLIPFATAYRDAGHEVLVAGHPAAEPLAAREGLAFHPVASATEERLAAVRDMLDGAPTYEDSLVVAARELFVGSHGRAALGAMLAVVEGWRPDVILRETGEISSLLAAEVYGVPDVLVGIALSASSEPYFLELAAPAVEELRSQLGLAADPGMARARRAPVFTQAAAALDVPGQAVPAVLHRYRGPQAEAARSVPDWWGGSTAPLVPVSFGTVAPTDGFYPGLYRAAIDALAELPARVLVTVGVDADPAALGALPKNVHAERWVPMADILADAAAMVMHGGAGTTLAALAAGVPTVVMPLFADQPLNARQIAKLGVGVALEGGAADVSRLREAVQTVLDEPRYRAAAGRIAEEIRELPPIEESAAELEAIAGAAAGAR